MKTKTTFDYTICTHPKKVIGEFGVDKGSCMYKTDTNECWFSKEKCISYLGCSNPPSGLKQKH